MISYSQNGEDVLLNRFFQGEPPQVYVDVGAGHPTFHSVTRHFYDAGWHGINLEPRPDLWKQLTEKRVRDINLQVAASNASGTLSFFEVHVPADKSLDNGGLSTMDAALADHYRKLGFAVDESPVQVRTLDDILTEHGINEIGFLKIDCEGLEAAVLAGLDRSRFRPRVIVVESTIPMSDQRSDAPLRQTLEATGYRYVIFDGLNSYFVRSEEGERAERLATPVCIFDRYQTVEEFRTQQRIVELETRLLLAERELAMYRGLTGAGSRSRAVSFRPGDSLTAISTNDLRVHIPAHAFKSHAGTEDAQGIRIPPEVTSAYVVFGPYERIPVGHYRANFCFDEGFLPGNRLRLDIIYSPSGQVLAEGHCTVASEASLEFDHQVPEALLEYRVYVEGEGVPYPSLFTGVELVRTEEKIAC